MEEYNSSTVDIIAKIIGDATVEVMERSTGTKIYMSPSVQKIPTVHLRPDIGCFVQFGGDYAGLVIINFDGATAFNYYRKSMLFMGLTEDDLVEDETNEEVLDTIGELVNQITGKFRQNIQKYFGLSAMNKQPKAISIRDSILLSVKETMPEENQCRRLSFKLESEFPFHVEFFIEKTEFTDINKVILPDAI